MRRVARLVGIASGAVGLGLQEGGGEERGGEGEEVKSDEEDFVKGAEEEKYCLKK